MALELASSSIDGVRALENDLPWERLYALLRPRVTRWVRSSCLSSWSGQKEEIVTDIVQEAMLRLLRYVQRAERGEVAPVDSLEHFGLIIAYNCFRDLWRHDRCFVYIIRHDGIALRSSLQQAASEQLDAALENVFNEWLFALLAREIVRFPDKQRTALLMDLASRMHFGSRPTMLQRAFREVGIRLEEYRRELPADPAERGRHASLLSLAYKRLAKIACEQ